MDNNKTDELPVAKMSERRRQRSTLYKILLRTELPTGLRTERIKLEIKYLCVLCLKNVKAHSRMYHMFYSTERDLDKDYASIGSLYAKDPDIKPFNKVTIHSICPVTLHRSAVNHFAEYTWNKDGNVLITPISEPDMWIMSDKF